MNGKPNIKAHILNEIERSIDILDSDTDPHFTVHEIRKSFKKIRSYLRLVRDEIDFKLENRFFRDIGMEISDIRDITSSMEALDALSDANTVALPDTTHTKIRNYLTRSRNKLSKLVFIQDAILESIRDKLIEKKAAIRKWDLQPSIEKISSNFHKTIQKANGAAIIAKGSDSTENYHEWRKKVKHLRYQVELLADSLLPYNEKTNLVLNQLSDYLGWDHDLAILEMVLGKNRRLFSSKNQKNEFKDLLLKRRCELKKAAIETNENKLSYELIS